MKVEKLQKRVAYITVATPFLITAFAFFLGWLTGAGISELALFVGMYIVSILGITLGYHRYFAHKSFDIHPLGVKLLLIAGSTAGQGPVLFWVSTHRLHHQKSDREGDPHSPNVHDNSSLGHLFKDIWHAHVGWMFKLHFDIWHKYVRDLLNDPAIVKINMQYFLWLAVGIILPGIINFTIHGTPYSFFTGVLWGGFIRIFFGHHCTWSINSVCHLIGRRNFKTKDNSRNNYLFGILTLGEGFHNNHHAFPYSARHGLLPFQIDFTYLVIKVLQVFNVVKNVRLPNEESIQSKRIIS